MRYAFRVAILICCGAFLYFEVRAPRSRRSAAPAEPESSVALAETPPASADRWYTTRPSQVSTTDSPKQLQRSWNRGQFVSPRKIDISKKLDQNLIVQLRTTLNIVQEQRLREKLASFLNAYSSTAFDGYLRFREERTLPKGPDGSTAAAVAKLREQWNEVGEQNGASAISSVDFDRCRVTIARLARERIIPEEWDARAGVDSHFFKSFTAWQRASISPLVLKLRVRNDIEAAQIVRRSGELLFADFEIVQHPPGENASPLLLRFIWDEKRELWLPLNAMRLQNSRRNVFFW